MNTVVLISFVAVLLALAVGYIFGHDRGYKLGKSVAERRDALHVAKLLRNVRETTSPYWRN